MAPASDTPISVRLPAPLLGGVAAFADANRLDLPEAIEELVRRALTFVPLDQDYLPGLAGDQARAESELFGIIDKIVMRKHQEDTWGEDVTNTVFEAIQADEAALEVYRRAIAGEQVGRINRRIGSKTRKLLGADVIKDQEGKRVFGQPSRSAGALIKTYTKLCRPGAINQMPA